MTVTNLIEGKKILIVDDESDVLEMLEEELEMCELSKASSFDEAKQLLETQSFDIAILDIMGVDGFRLLQIANEKSVIAVMLTAHALSRQNLVKSQKEGAASYIAKSEIGEIQSALIDIMEAKDRGKSPWWRWHDRFGSYFEKKFGSEWSSQGEFWREIYAAKWEKYYY
jgi:DNA-binding NtrC family response regulator